MGQTQLDDQWNKVVLTVCPINLFCAGNLRQDLPMWAKMLKFVKNWRNGILAP